MQDPLVRKNNKVMPFAPAASTPSLERKRINLKNNDISVLVSKDDD
jgi:hypothetical protein